MKNKVTYSFHAPAWERCNGFSLIELSVVLLIMTLMATVAIRSTNDLTFQVRYEQTQERLQQIKEAILGNPKQIINGQLVVSGFVADMGRLPNDIHELLEKDFCSNWLYVTQLDCEANGGAWNTMPSYATGVCTVAGNYNKASCEAATGNWNPNLGGLGVGWRGSYLNVSASPTSSDAFTDGWGNVATTDTEQNYGWIFTPTIGDLTIQSLGKNQVQNNADTGYDEDYPANQPVIKDAPNSDWRLDISGGINVSFVKPLLLGCTDPTKLTPATCVSPDTWTVLTSKTICMKVFYRKSDSTIGDLTSDSNSATPTTLEPVTISQDGSSQTINFFNFKDLTNTLVPMMPIGQNAIGIYEHDGTSCTTTLYPADRQSIPVDFHPNTTLPVINW